MSIEMYAVQDKGIGMYSNPFYAKNHMEAMRFMKSTVTDSNTNLAKYPEDFNLVHVGNYNDDIGIGDFNKKPVHIISIKEIKDDIEKAIRPTGQKRDSTEGYINNTSGVRPRVQNEKHS